MTTKMYLASPLGFAESTRPFLHLLKERIGSLALYDVFDPWDQQWEDEVQKATSLDDSEERVERLASINRRIAAANESAIRECAVVVAVLDGVDIDSGTASEIGFAFALGKTIFGLRTDFRRIGDNEAAPINLQVGYWIEASGGAYLTNVDDLINAISKPSRT